MQAFTDLISDHKLDFIGLQEIKEVVADSFLLSISGSFTFNWITLSVKKTAGGILVGLKDDLFEIISPSAGLFHVSVIIRNRLESFVWQLVVVYGTAYADQKMDFFTELHDVMDNSIYMVVYGTNRTSVAGCAFLFI
jgi:hypothetical protein